MRKREWTGVAALVSALVSMAVADTNVQITALALLHTNTVRLSWTDNGSSFCCTDTTAAAQCRFYRVAAIGEATNRFYVVEQCDDLRQPFSPFTMVLGNWNGSNTTQEGTAQDDSLIFFGTAGPDHVIQPGYDGNDSLYASGDDGDDIIEQEGGAGTNTFNVSAGTGSDWIRQIGGPNDDNMYIDAGDGNDWIYQSGGDGNDIFSAYGGHGNDTILISGGDGNDTIRCDGGDGNDVITVLAGSGDDTITYDCSDGQDTVLIDGGPGTDSLTINRNSHSYKVLDAQGNVLHHVGSGGAVITVLNIETIVHED